MESKSRVNVVDKRRTAVADDLGLPDIDDQEIDNLAAEVTRRLNEEVVANPIDVLLSKTFQFILAQPEWLAVLNLSKPERKRFEKAVAKMMSRFPHMSKADING